MKITIAHKIFAVLLSGLFYYLGFSMSGNFGWAMWIAPVTVLYISLYVTARQAFGFAFLAYLIGRLAWLPYLLSVLPTALAILFTFILPLVFALILIASRRMVLTSPHWFSALTFPFLITAFEYFLFLLSKDGTMTSIAYTQSNYLPVIQIASLTGILGITFLISFVPSAIAVGWHFREQKKLVNVLVFVLFLILADVYFYGSLRLKQTLTGNTVKIGLVAIDESNYRDKQMHTENLYLQEISKLADQGVQVILIPEKAIAVTDSSAAGILQKFTELAVNRKIQIIIGGAKQKTDYWLNNAWVISNEGKLLADYQKVNLFAGEEMDKCKPGNQIAIFPVNKINEGVAICKDMDFQQYILGYSKKSPAILYVPAWDFSSDGWLHSRMAILRSVEGGFSLVRNAREGRLTISDWRGKIVSEANSEEGKLTTLTGNLTIAPHPTPYARAGDWFGTISLFVAVGFLLYMFMNRKKAALII